MHNFNHYLKQVNEKSFKDFPFELHYTADHMRAGKGFKSIQQAVQYATTTPGISEWSLFKNGSGFHSTTQDEFLIYWYDNGGNYWSNRSVKEPALLAKKYNKPVTTSETHTFNVPSLIQLFYVEDINGKAVGLYKDHETANKLQNQSKGKIYNFTVDRNLYNNGKINASNAKNYINENVGELQQVQAGEVIKLQKPAPETFVNKKINNDSVEIADCTVCGAEGVLVQDHICKTVVDNTMPDQHNVVDESATDPLEFIYTTVLNCQDEDWKVKLLSYCGIGSDKYAATHEYPTDKELANALATYHDHIISSLHSPDVFAKVDAMIKAGQTPMDYLNPNHFESLRTKYGVNESKMLTKIEWFKNIVLNK